MPNRVSRRLRSGAFSVALLAGCAQVAGLTGDYHAASGGGAGVAGKGGTFGSGGKSGAGGRSSVGGGAPNTAGSSAAAGVPNGGFDGGAGSGGIADAGASAGGDGGFGGGVLGAGGTSGGTGKGGALGLGGTVANAGQGGRPGAGGASGGKAAAGGSGAGGSGAGGSGAGGSGAGGAAQAGAGNGGVGGTLICGNGALSANELCDDGNTRDGDGCSQACVIESGFTCAGAPSACNRSCGAGTNLCGPSANKDCCASLPVPAGAFNRSNDSNYPATLSEFRLDAYEITVARFRAFVAAYSQTMIPSGAGKNPNNASDTGWDSSWNAVLPASRNDLIAAVQCDAATANWSANAGPRDALPMNCITWFEALAFCIWDGGRLPTEAEWNYAAAGGAEQRIYPWGTQAPDCSYANFNNGSSCAGSGFDFTNRVGSESPKGDGKFGQSDLAGNVWEWTQDTFKAPYPMPCTNCANLSASTTSARVIRGGSFYYEAALLLTSYRDSNIRDDYIAPQNRYGGTGARCARAR